MSDRYLHAIWCDDVRHEIGNKPSFMGCYISGIVIPSLPAVLPKLAIFAWAVTPADRQFEKATLKISRDDGTIISEMAVDNLDEIVNNSPMPSDAKIATLMIGFNMNGVEIPENCQYLSISMETEAELLEGPKLRINVVATTPPEQ